MVEPARDRRPRRRGRRRDEEWSASQPHIAKRGMSIEVEKGDEGKGVRERG